jgi:hypothetical protein
MILFALQHKGSRMHGERNSYWLMMLSKQDETQNPFHFTILHISAALDPHTDGIVNAKKKGSASDALTSLAGQTDGPHDGWRCPGY